MGNRPEFLESALAVNRVGAAFLPLNVRLAEPELEYIIRHAGATAIVTEPGLAGPVAAISGRMETPWTVVLAGEGGGERGGRGGGERGKGGGGTDQGEGAGRRTVRVVLG